MNKSTMILGGVSVGLIAWFIYSARAAKAVDTDDGEASGVLSGVDGFIDAAFSAGGLIMDAKQMSLAGLYMLKKHEGFSATVYNDIAGNKTIGYGHMLTPLESYTRITEAEATALLAEDLSTAELAVSRLVKVPLTQNQYDALVSFVYNVGAGAFARSTMLQLLNQGNYSGAALQFSRWNKAGGKVSVGLTNRRNAEMAMFNGNKVIA